MRQKRSSENIDEELVPYEAESESAVASSRMTTAMIHMDSTTFRLFKTPLGGLSTSFCQNRSTHTRCRNSTKRQKCSYENLEKNILMIISVAS